MSHRNIQSFDFRRLEHMYTDIMIDHQIGELFAVDQHDPFLDHGDILKGVLRKG
jgi:hypothetical protein